MTVAAKRSKISYQENGATLVFPVPFRFLPGSIAASRVLVGGTVVPLVAGVDFTTSGGETDAGGSLTLGSSVAGARLRIRRATARQQQTNYTVGDRFPAESHEAALDRQMLINQEQDDLADDTATRALLVPDGETAPIVPPASERGNKFVSFGADGKTLVMSYGPGADANLRGDLAEEAGHLLVNYPRATASEAVNLAKLNAMIAATAEGEDLDLKGETFIVDARPTNPRGVKIVNGLVPEPHPNQPAYRTVRRSYADSLGYVVGLPNMAPFFLACQREEFQVALSVGHSWVEQNVLFAPRAHTILQYGMYDAGINNCTVIPIGKGGAKWSDVNVDPDLGLDSNMASNVHCVFATFNLNDLPDGVETTIARMKAFCAHHRGLALGAADKCALVIVLVGNIDGVENGVDATVLDLLRGGAIECVREYDATVVDMAAMMWDVKIGRGLFLDAPGYHPTGNLANGDAISAPTWWYWRHVLAGELFKNGGWNSAKANTFWNVSRGVQQWFPSGEPQIYPYGRSQWGVLTADVFPVSGAMAVERQADGTTVQSISTLDGVPRRVSRHGSGLLWTQWCNLPVSVAYLNGWDDFGGGYAAVKAMATDAGMIRVFGSCKGGSSGAEAIQLPANLIPAQSHRRDVEGGHVLIFGVTGKMVFNVSSTAHIGFDIEFPALAV